jgi:hypothetical protein
MRSCHFQPQKRAGEPSKESGSATLSFGAVLAIGKIKARLSRVGGGGGVLGGKEAIDPSEGGAAVDDDGEEESSSSSPSNECKCDEIKLRVRSVVINCEDEVDCLFSYAHESHINNWCQVASRAGLM